MMVAPTRPTKRPPAGHISSRHAVRFAPLALAAGREGIVFGAVCVAFCLLLLVVDARTPTQATVGTLVLFPVASAGWLLGRRLVLTVLLVALASRLLAIPLAHLDPLTATSQMLATAATGVIAHVAAVNVSATRAAAIRAALVARVSRIASSAENVEMILREVLTEMARDGLRGGVVAFIDERDRLYIAAAEGEADQTVLDSRLPLGEGIMGQVAARGRPILVGDLDSPTSPAPANRMLGSNAGIRSLVVVPLITAGRVIGVLELDSGQPDRFDAEDLSVLEQIATSIAGAAQRAGALQLADTHLRQRVREQSLLLDTARSLAFAEDLAFIYREAARAAATIASPDPEGRRRGALMILRPGDELELVAEYDELGVTIERREYGVDDLPGVRTALAGRVPVVMDPDQPPLRELAIRHLWRHIAWAPVRAGGDAFGLLVLPCRGEPTFGDSSLRLLQGVADVAGLAIGNARRLELERARIVELQEYSSRMASLDDAKSEFLRLASHELRGPLGIARGYVSMIEDGSLGDPGPDIRRIVPVILDKLREMNFLIDQMLETARLDDSRLQLKLQTLDLSAVVSESVRSLAGHLGTEHRLEVDDDGKPKPMVGDPARLGTIIANLLDNAVKYSPEGGGVRCRVRRLDSQAIVEVADDGLGIAPEDMPRLFTRFGRLVTPENSHIGGTGLGLYLARELARMHGGDITATSEVERGSTFRLALPLTGDDGR